MRTRYLFTVISLIVVAAILMGQGGRSSNAFGTAVATLSSTEAATMAATQASIYQTKIVKSGLPHFVDFNAVWCDPCNRMRPSIAHLKVKYAGKLIFDSFDIDHEESYDVMTLYYPIGTIIPYMLLLDKNLKIVKRLDAYMTQQELDDEFSSFLANLPQ
jgi:thiol-disulfide isomerase/thioredoxin